MLLRPRTQIGDFLAGPTVAPAPRPGASSVWAPVQKIGHYKLLQMIGEGGFGEVFMAEQESPCAAAWRTPKIIKAGMDSKQIVARFEAERQALAMMDI